MALWRGKNDDHDEDEMKKTKQEQQEEEERIEKERKKDERDEEKEKVRHISLYSISVHMVCPRVDLRADEATERRWMMHTVACAVISASSTRAGRKRKDTRQRKTRRRE